MARVDTKQVPEEDAVEVIVDSIHVRAEPPPRVVVLRAKEQDLWLPIFVGAPEADAMALVLQGRRPPRPLSHDLMLSLVQMGGLTLQRATVTHKVGDTLHAALTLRRGRGAAVEVDARPSDAISLALRADAPVYVARDLLGGLSHLGWTAKHLQQPAAVLLATTDRSATRLIKGALSSEGHTVRVTPSAAAALDALREDACDAVIADWRLPDMSGHRLLQAAKDVRPSGIATIILRGPCDTLGEEDAELWSVPYGFVTKPVTADALIRSVARAVDAHRRTQSADERVDNPVTV